MVDTGAGDDHDTGLLERTPDVVGEKIEGESANDSDDTGPSSDLEPKPY